MHTRMHDYTIKENFIAQEGQKVFRMDRPFVNGTINVYVNGALQSFGESGDYTTFGDSGSILFSKPLSSGDVIAAITNERVSSIKVMSFGRRDAPDALYQKYGSSIKLRYNNKYHVSVCIDGKPIEWSFNSVLTPMWSTVKRIKQDIGEFIQGMTDEQIEIMIHRSSWELYDKIQAAVDEGSDTLNEHAEPLLEADPETGEYKNTYNAAKNWVRYDSEINLIYARYYGISLHYGTREKTIGDIRIRNEVKLPYLDNLLDNLKGKLDDMEREIFGADDFAMSFQKGRIKYDYKTVARTVSW